MAKAKITDINGNELDVMVDMDDMYLTLQEVLLDGKTMGDLTNSQVAYLYSTVKTQQELQIIFPEYAGRLTGVKPHVLPNKTSEDS